MSTTRLHHSLPAPVVHAGFSVPQSKSHVLAGVQDAYWSDDETEEAECPLCLEEMDICDLNFKPCVCGYLICRFCWHHIKENLNKRCPACRRLYTDEAVEFKPIAPEDLKRLTQQKKQRDRERKELENLGRKHLANVRVVQRNVVYVVGIGPRFAKEELIPTLRSTEYFGQYGKISKILLVKRNSPGEGGPVVGLYITYHRKEDAGRCIAAVDGVQSPGGGRDTMRASYGTTKYCLAFLRGVHCSDHSCMNLHEWGDEKDCFTKEDLATLKHTIKATENRSRSNRKLDDDSLPRAASWAQKGSGASGATSPFPTTTAALINSRQSRRAGVSRQSKATTFGERKTSSDRKNMTTTSRPSTPVPSESVKVEGVSSATTKQKDIPHSNSPAPSLGASEPGSAPMEASLEASRSDSGDTPYRATWTNKPADLNGTATSAIPSNPPGLAPPGLPPRLPVPPGLPAPPGISQGRPLRSETESPQTPLLASQTSYQMSTAARALVEDIKARRGSSISHSSSSPFPDFDRTLQTLSGDDGGFSFNLDPKLASQITEVEELPEFGLSPSIPFRGSYMEAFPALRGIQSQPHSLSQAHGPGHSIYDPAIPSRPGHYLEKNISRGSSYVGSFNPFSDSMIDTSPPPQFSDYSPVDEERKVSRFRFARGRLTPAGASSPPQPISPLTSTIEHHPFHITDDVSVHMVPSWQRSHDVGVNPLTLDSSFVNPSVQAQPISMSGPNQLPSIIGHELSEAQLRSFIFSSQDRTSSIGNFTHGGPFTQSQPFEDPAIMSLSYTVPANQESFAHMSFGPPPGLSGPQRPAPSLSHQSATIDGRNTGAQLPQMTSPVPPSLLSNEDFPALMPSSFDPASDLNAASIHREPLVPVIKAREKAERKAAKKLAVVQKGIDNLSLSKAEAKFVHEPIMEKTSAIEETNDAAPTVKRKASESEELGKSKIATQTSPGSTEKTAPLRRTSKGNHSQSTTKRNDSSMPTKSTRSATTFRETSYAEDSAVPQLPLLSKKPKKIKPTVNAKPLRVLKEDDTHENAKPSVATDNLKTQPTAPDSSSSNSRSESRNHHHPITSVLMLLEQLDAMYPALEFANHPFFDPSRFTSPVKISLEYGPLVHALSALSVGGGSFANSIPSASIDNAVSSFQQLLETLTQTISDLLRLLPRTTWDDSSSFDGVLRDMLKGDDFLDDRTDVTTSHKEDEVAALTLALERRARWMEVQLAKLEELHRDINTAAVRAILCFNDSGWDRYHFLPRNGNSLARYSTIGTVEEDGVRRAMSVEELEKKLVVAQEAAVFAETELRESMAKFQVLKPY